MAKTAKKAPPPAPPADPMPRRVEPCVATLVEKPPKGPDWAFEVKWDGYRLALHIEGENVRAITRGGHDWTKKFPAIVADARELAVKSAIIDGEAVVLDDRGRSDFGLLQRALGRKPTTVNGDAISFYAFDLLYLNGHDLRRLPQSERREMLEGIVSDAGAIWLSQEVDADGEDFFRAACELGLEGIIAKRRDKPYHSGRRPEWQKIKCARRDWFVIVGYEPSTMPGSIGRLLLAAKKGDSLVYVGGCGTGWNNKESVKLRELLDAIPASRPPVALKRKGALFSEPLLVAEVEYRAWTQDGKLRHPSFKAVTKLINEIEVYRLDPSI